MDNLGKDDFKALRQLYLPGCDLTDVGCATLVSALDNGGMPLLHTIYDINPESNPDTSEEACQAVVDAVKRVRARRS